MDVAGGRGLGRVDVGVCVDPDETDSLVLCAEVVSHAGDGAGGDGVISAENNGCCAVCKSALHELCGLFCTQCDLFQEVSVVVTTVHRLSDRDGNVAPVGDGVAKGFEFCCETCDAQGGWTHVNPATLLSQIEWHTDDLDLPCCTAHCVHVHLICCSGLVTEARQRISQWVWRRRMCAVRISLVGFN